ncbi:hypothetical protein AAG570_009833 [Ranatra chinensis]|uniref:Uncharacterized protein n=1 Tax=Ranatra chinensis TaxID=642074 RepID=A0ABD0YQT9_9HEMI
MHAQDAEGRTALHYAATLPDNGHFFSLLVTLGADRGITDKEGNTAEHYLRNPGQLTHFALLSQYQGRSNKLSGFNVNQYSDKDVLLNKEAVKGIFLGAEILQEGYPVFAQEESRYLASSLGEPLIKGLTEVARVRPKAPIVYLANFLLSFSNVKRTENTNQLKVIALKYYLPYGIYLLF